MHTILFVDDEQGILEGLRALLWRRRREWRTFFADNAEAALRTLRAEPCDVMVSDIRMPQTDGVALLRQVRLEFPHVARIILTGQAELAATLQSVPIAHQFLNKPIDPLDLQEVLRRTCDLMALIHDPELRRVVGQANDLPSLPKTYEALIAALAEPEMSVDRVSQIISGDVGMCAELLRLVNSAYFGATRNIKSVRPAVSYLGANILRNLVLQVELFRSFPAHPPLPGLNVATQQRHAVLTARIAAALLSGASSTTRELAAASGMLQGVGKLVLLARQHALCAKAQAEGPLWQVLREHYGIDHVRVGAYLLGLWGFPFDIVEMVARCERPADTQGVMGAAPGSEGPKGGAGLGVLGALHVATYLAASTLPQGTNTAPPLAVNYLESLGLDVSRELPRWQRLAVQEAERGPYGSE